jgi:hypothetical protein
MTDKFRAVARRSYLDMGMPKVGRELIGLYPTRKEAEMSQPDYRSSDRLYLARVAA